MVHNKAFTLVELIVWVTISMLLMTSVWVLVSGGMQNILKQQKIMQKNSLLTTSVSDFYNGFDNISLSGGYIHNNSSGALFKINQNIQKWGFWYFWIISQDNQYCPTDSDLPTLDYLTWKTFIPYEEIDEDIMNTYSGSTYQDVSTGSITYKVDTLNHRIYENNWLWDNIIIWWEVFWHEFTGWADWTDVRLNNPTGIVLAEWGFFFSDTLNHRILFYEDWKVSLVLDKNDGLSEPTWLAFDNSNNTLYIANSWKWEILKYSSENISTNPDLEINFSPNQDIINSTQFTLNFSENISSPTHTWAFSTWNEDYARIVDGNYEYYFTDYRGDDIIYPAWSSISWCGDNTNYSFSLYTPKKTITDCTSNQTWSIIEYTWNIGTIFLQDSPYLLNLSNIIWDFSSAWNHLVELEFFNTWTPLYKETFKYFTQWDEEVKNWENMTLSVFANDLQYPTGLEISWWNTQLKINDFISRKEYTYIISDWNRTETKNLNDFNAENFAQFDYSNLTDTILENPISNISVNYNSNYFSTNVEYYQFINCYNPDEKVKKSLIFSKNLQ
jgi:hypothetical protein